ncbi:hypothetical protein Indivirus_9_9 [Indivirus ILV1]|uniref:Uncharacterized protein n=1 Tax=Indivirus ILV1 TaxID=1977633 RepID=A0A1V0SE98_9VIRU|nr:hypothetical protein Indivirus_9_9 [Indivirus ILV1]
MNKIKKIEISIHWLFFNKFNNIIIKMAEIPGLIILDGITFDVGYRFGGSVNHQGGYSKCLRIYNGKKGQQIINGHDFFGDDKFEVLSSDENANNIVLELSWPLVEVNKRYNDDTLIMDRNVTMMKMKK